MKKFDVLFTLADAHFFRLIISFSFTTFIEVSSAFFLEKTQQTTEGNGKFVVLFRKFYRHQKEMFIMLLHSILHYNSSVIFAICQAEYFSHTCTYTREHSLSMYRIFIALVSLLLFLLLHVSNINHIILVVTCNSCWSKTWLKMPENMTSTKTLTNTSLSTNTAQQQATHLFLRICITWVCYVVSSFQTYFDSRWQTA